jgi:hypothetical protein
MGYGQWIKQREEGLKETYIVYGSSLTLCPIVGGKV